MTTQLNLVNWQHYHVTASDIKQGGDSNLIHVYIHQYHFYHYCTFENHKMKSAHHYMQNLLAARKAPSFYKCDYENLSDYTTT